MVGFVHEDKTKEVFTVLKTSKIMKLFSLIPLSLEVERNFASVCVLFGVETFTSDILGNVQYFTLPPPIQADSLRHLDCSRTVQAKS